MSTLSRRALLAGLMPSAAGLLVACGGAGSPAPTGAVEATPTGGRVGTGVPGTAPTALSSTSAIAVKGSTVLQLFTFSKVRSDWLAAVAKMKGEEQHVPFSLDVQNVGKTSDVTDKLQAILAGGAPPPDLAEVEIGQFPRWVRAGQPAPFVPLNDALQGRQKELFAASATNPWTWEGKVYGLGNELNASLLSVRGDLFAQAGLDASKPIATWRDFLDVGRRIKTVAPSGITYWGGGDFVFLSMQAGGGLFDGTGKPMLDNPANLKALELVQDAVVKQQVVVLDPGTDGHNSLILQGGVCALTGPSWKFSGMVRQVAPKTSGEWRLLPLPAWEMSGAHLSWSQGGTGVVAPATGKYTQAAVDFIMYAHLTKAVLLDYDLRNVYPTWQGAYDDPRLKQPVDFFGGQIVAEMVVKAAADMAPFLTSPIYPQVQPLASGAAISVIHGKQTPTDALKAAQQQAVGIAAQQAK